MSKEPNEAGVESGVAAEGTTSAVDEFVQEARVRTFKDHESRHGSGDVVSTTVMTWKAPDPAYADRCNGMSWITKSAFQSQDDEFVQISHECLDDRGYSVLGRDFPTIDVRLEYVEPQYALPANIHIGQAWTGERQGAGGKAVRSCILERSRVCHDGVATLCIGEMAGTLMWTRDHYCRGDGWRGYEAVYIGEDDVLTHMWSSDLVTDGRRFDNHESPPHLPNREEIRRDLARIQARVQR